jgi:hypothetical protein
MRDEQHVHDDLTARFEKLRGMLRRIATYRSAAHHVEAQGGSRSFQPARPRESLPRMPRREWYAPVGRFEQVMASVSHTV